MWPTRFLVASRLASVGGAPLIRSHPRFYIPHTLTNITGGVNTRVIRHQGIGSRRSFFASAQLSSLSAPTPPKKDGATNPSKHGPSSQPGSKAHQTSSPSEDDFKVSFHNLGMNRITKFVVYATIGVLGTMETIFWCKVLWRWWTGSEDDADNSENSWK